MGISSASTSYCGGCLRLEASTFTELENFSTFKSKVTKRSSWLVWFQ